ncbi:MAG: DNA adenine methylase [Desulfovibrio sp.]|nr:DNA adenine methylase [Desulfovibrio sp.]
MADAATPKRGCRNAADRGLLKLLEAPSPSVPASLSAPAPFVKWAGGKRQLLGLLCARAPARFGRYYEPFVGGGAMLFALRPERACVSDANAQLVNCYRQLKEDAKAVAAAIQTLDAVPCSRERYLALRSRYNGKLEAGELDCEGAALFIWLNRHCFNGLYRVNGKGLFNVPWNGRTQGPSASAERLAATGGWLKAADVELGCGDFEQACEAVEAGDFVYFDPPYVPVSQTARFTSYARQGFAEADQERLAALFARLDARGAKLLLSNSDAPLVRRLYRGWRIEAVDAKRAICSDASKRTGREIIVANFASFA